MINVKSCPFCGSKDLQIITPPKKEDVWWSYRLWCGDCHAYGPPASSEEGAIRFWNQRMKE